MDKDRFPIFDGHNDVLIRLEGQQRHDLFERGEAGHVDLPRAREGGLAGGFCAVFTQAPGYRYDQDDPPPGFPPTPDLAYAQRRTVEVMARLFRLAERPGDRLRVVRSAAEIEACIAEG